ncbi:MAG TPA: hypothetical protein EYP04_06170, partial [Anaerolineae bacterium]|nr:hypothetical protein [Anaerolineae bacterium]HIQ05021.1 hypothetical protein [Anaerolineae bacterium]
MMIERLILAGRIRQELGELARVIERAEASWHHFQTTGDDLYLDGVALNLHGFYTGLERVFELIASEIDLGKPAGSSWHQELLRQMSAEVPRVRPAVISPQTRDRLDEYRGFRHVVRNVYTYNLDTERIQRL